MKFSVFLSEMSSIITASRNDLKNYGYSYDELSQLAHKSERQGYYNYKDINMIKTSTSTKYFVLDDEKKEVLFYSKISVVEGSRYKGPVETQTFIYQSMGYPGAAEYIFREVILENHKVILADSEQTKGGQRFWFNMFNKYKGSSRYEIGYYDLVDKKYIPYTKESSKSDFDDVYRGFGEYNTKLYIKKK